MFCLFICRKQVLATKEDAERDQVKVPTTLQEYCVSSIPSHHNQVDADFYDDTYVDDLDDEEEDMYHEDDEEDSGNEES